jgi:hypothetical protein
LLDFQLGDKQLGDEVKLADGGGTLTARVSLNSIVPVDRLEIIGNGEVVATVPLTGDRTRISTTVTLPVSKSGWFLLRALGEGPAYPILDVYPYATTSPIYVSVGGRPIQSRKDADYFIRWIDRLEAGARSHTDWNSPAEKAAALDIMRQAREEFARRGGE